MAEGSPSPLHTRGRILLSEKEHRGAKTNELHISSPKPTSPIRIWLRTEKAGIEGFVGLNSANMDGTYRDLLE
jgi:hypothetical protein